MNEHRRAIVGALLLIIGALTFWGAETVAAGAWSNPAYSFRNDVISDLGDPVPHDYLYGHAVNSPLYFLMNFGFAANGILYGVALFLLYPIFPKRGRIAILVSGMLAALGLVVVSVFHEQSANAFEMGMHWLGAFLILTDVVTIVLVSAFGGRVGAPAWYRALSAVFGIIIFLSFMSIVTVPSLAVRLGAGAMDRTAMWGALVWQVITGIVLLVGARLSPLHPAHAVHGHG
jgi:hypothetical protein